MLPSQLPNLASSVGNPLTMSVCCTLCIHLLSVTFRFVDFLHGIPRLPTHSNPAECLSTGDAISTVLPTIDLVIKQVSSCSTPSHNEMT